ncbi:MAG: ABC transporter ATP-binding protein [Sulfolobales archaeon]|nr:ABC transporter ATP-binding protein [Sulfolobales archaeon]MDW8083281.1 ABC transporter ATP-binding protein [Sulfolobales archaeon]
MIKVSELVAGYGKLKVLFNVNLVADTSRITVVVGPNGAGKTTLLNSITGLATIHSGKVIFQDRDVTGWPPHKVSRLGLSYVPQMGNVFSNLTVEENLRVAGYLLDHGRLLDRLALVFEMFPVLKNFRYRRAGTLSGGERRMLAIGMGLMKEPRAMLLDEVTTDLAPIFVKKVLDKVVELRDQLKLTVVLVEQHAIRALQIADKAYLLVSGTIRYEGSPQDLLSNQEFSKLYLGIS